MGNDAWTLLNDVGIELMRYRGWGYRNPITGRHEVAGQLAEQNFCDDHHWMLGAVKGSCPPSLPRRSVFGLPHNYFFKSDNAKAEVAPSAKGRTRRASPLFIHLHRFPTGRRRSSRPCYPLLFCPPETK